MENKFFFSKRRKETNFNQCFKNSDDEKQILLAPTLIPSPKSGQKERNQRAIKGILRENPSELISSSVLVLAPFIKSWNLPTVKQTVWETCFPIQFRVPNQYWSFFCPHNSSGGGKLPSRFSTLSQSPHLGSQTAGMREPEKKLGKGCLDYPDS